MNHRNNPFTDVLFISIIILILLLTLLGVVIIDTAHGAQPIGDFYFGPLTLSEVGWMGTAVSSADEWYEIFNSSTDPVSTDGWVIEAVRPSGTYTSAIPVVTIAPGDVALFERTDDSTVPEVAADGIHGSGHSLVGIFPNTDITSLRIYDSADEQNRYHKIVFANGEWPAGMTSPHASMAWTDGPAGWVTSNQSISSVTYGSPGLVNTGNVAEPDTCDSVPASWEIEMVFNTGEAAGYAWHPRVVVTSDLLGLQDGQFTAATGTTVWDFTMETGQWVHQTTTYTGSPTNDCIDAHEMARDAVDNVISLGHPGDFFPSENIGLWEVNMAYAKAVYDFINLKSYEQFMPMMQVGG